MAIALITYLRTREDCSSLQHIIDVLHHDALYVSQLTAKLSGGAGASGSGATLSILFPRALHPRIKLNKCVWPCHCINLKDIRAPLKIIIQSFHPATDGVLDVTANYFATKRLHVGRTMFEFEWLFFM